MEHKSNSLLNITKINSKHQKSSSLPNLPTGEEEPPCAALSSSKRTGSPWTRNPRIILQKTWNKIYKSINKKRPTNSAPPTPNSLMKFDFEDDDNTPSPRDHLDLDVEEMVDPVHLNYAKLQKRLSEELHQGQIQFGSKSNGKAGYNNVSGEFKKKLQQWEMWKVSCGKVTYTDEELKLILPEDFGKKLKKWEAIKSNPGHSSTSTNNVKIEKQIQWLEKQLEKVELEKCKLEKQMRKFLEKEARLEKMREALKNPREEEGLIAAAGADENFTQKLYEWEELRIPRDEEQNLEEGSTCLLAPKYYQHLGGSSNSSKPPTPESEDLHECHDDHEPEANTPVSSSSLESINQASGSNTSSADFYQKSRRRSSSLSFDNSAFTSDDEDNAQLLKTVEEEEMDDKLEPPPNPVVRVNQIVVEEEEEEATQSHLIVATRRTLIKPIETEPLPSQPRLISLQSASASSSTLKDLSSPSLVKYISSSSSSSTNSHHVVSSSVTISRKLSSPSPSTSPKIRVEDIWNKNVDVSPPPIREGPKVVGFIPKVPIPIVSSSSSTSTMTISTTNPTPAPAPGFSGVFTQQNKSLFGSCGGGSGGGESSLRNFPRMGKIPVWVSPLVARRRMNSTSSCTGPTTDKTLLLQQQERNNEFSLDRFLENRNLGSALSVGTVRNSKYTFGGGFPPQQQDEQGGPLITLSRSNSFGLGKLAISTNSVSQTNQERVKISTTTSTSLSIPPRPPVLKSKSTSSVLKSGLNLFTKVRKSENLTHNNNSNNNEPVKTTKARWFLNKF